MCHRAPIAQPGLATRRGTDRKTRAHTRARHGGRNRGGWPMLPAPLPFTMERAMDTEYLMFCQVITQALAEGRLTYATALRLLSAY